MPRWTAAPAFLLALAVQPPVNQQTHSAFPVDIVAGPAPQTVAADGRTWLIYELHLTNFAPLPVEISGVDVLGDGKVLASYGGQTLRRMVIPVEKLSTAASPPASGGDGQTIGEGHNAIVFIDLALTPGAPAPAELTHRLSLAVTRQNGERIQTTVTGAAVQVVQSPAVVLQAPLRGSGWVAFNALTAVDHRRSLNAVDGRERIPQRFAIDWMRLGPDGRLFHDDTRSNATFYDYGAEVLAVADGTVSDLKDGLSENVGTTERSERAITLENVLGNYVMLDLGRSRFAVYAHLQPGSFRVKAGDKVKAGQTLALLGNSGNSDAPHLHFHLVNANSPLAAEGIPYELETFTHVGVIDPQQENALLTTGLKWNSTSPHVTRRREFPVVNAVVDFP